MPILNNFFKKDEQFIDQTDPKLWTDPLLNGLEPVHIYLNYDP